MEQIILIDSPANIDEHESIIEKFFSLYLNNFPDPDEREDPQIILGRITNQTERLFSPATTLILAINETSDILGGSIVEYYSESQCILLTYIVVAPESRGQGIARKLINQGIPRLITQKKIEVEAVFFESNIPGKTKVDSFDPWQRYQVFSRMGAKWLDISYTQPSLDRNKKRVYNLYLFIFPHLTGKINRIQKNTLLKFLDVFYRELGVEDPRSDTDFVKMQKKIKIISENDFIYLKEMPIKENCNYSFPNVAIAYHFSDATEINRIENKKGDRKNCPLFSSYEFDLFQYCSQQSPPYYSSCKTENKTKIISVHFPQEIHYTSEGRVETLSCQQKELRVEVKISCTQFRNNNRIWTIVFNPVKSDSFNQSEIIKLINLFCRTQEFSNVKESTVFFDEDKRFSTMEDLACHLMHEKQRYKISKIGSGIVELDISECYSQLPVGSNTWKTILEYIYKIHQGDIHAQMKLEKRYYEENEVRMILNLFCAFSLGIFDYNRMSFEEILDTIIPVVSSNHSVIIVNKGIIASFSIGNQLLQNVRDTIGISPYLLITSTALAYNDDMSLSSEKELDDLLDKSQADLPLTELRDKRKHLERILNEEILTNVFHYKTERILFEVSMFHRGLQDRINNIKARLLELDSLINDQVNRNRTRYDIIISILLVSISLISLEKVFGDVFKSIKENGGFSQTLQNEGFVWGSFIAFFIVAIVVFYYLKKKQGKISKGD